MENPIIMQAFYWEMNTGRYAEDFSEEAELWNLIADRASEFKESGFDFIWFPPANKGAAGALDVGYGTYDLWDLGEFDQKGNIRTKYGNKDDLDRAIKALHSKDIKVIYDAVLNHRMGADKKETVTLKDGEKAEVWTKFDFPNRNGKYSSLRLDWSNFDGVDWNERSKEEGEFLFKHKSWDNSFEDDYLMGADLDYANQSVREDVINWGIWIINDIDFDGFRFDASKHVDNSFLENFIKETEKSSQKDLLYIGESWVNDIETLKNYLQEVNSDRLNVFDFPLREAFVEMVNGNLDMRWLGNRGLINTDFGSRAVTFVDNHDTDRDGKNEYGTISISNRKYQAYTYILMRREGIPVIFWKDYYNRGMKEKIDKIIEARKKFAYGDAYESESNDENTYSYIRAGDEDHQGSGLVMMITQHDDGNIIKKKVNSGKASTEYYDFTGNIEKTVWTDENADGEFLVKGTSGEGYSIWVEKGDKNV
ncbi:MAG: alpha-amylase [Bacillota bacterium]